MKLKLNTYNAQLTIRRVFGIAMLGAISYWSAMFVIKLIFWSLYAGVVFIDKFFSFLIKLF